MRRPLHDWTIMLIYVYYLCVNCVFVHYVCNFVCFTTLSVVGNLLVLVYHVNYALYLTLNSIPILKRFSILYSNGR